MKGRILNFSFQTNSGIISGDDGNRYSFTGAEWQASEFPEAEMRVDFEASEDNATGIYLDTTAPAAATGVGGGSGGAAAQNATNTAQATASEWFGAAKEAAVKYSAAARVEAVKYWGIGLEFLKGVPRVWLIAGGAGVGVAVVAIIAVAALMATGVIGGGNPQPASAMDLLPDDVEGLRVVNVEKVLDDEYLADEFDLLMSER